MGRPTSPVIRLVAALLAALVPLLGAAVPTLDAQGAGQGPAFEREHHPGSCPTAHDHTICSQIGSKLVAAVPSPAPPRPDELRVGATVDTLPFPRAASLLGPPSRAPPSG